MKDDEHIKLKDGDEFLKDIRPNWTTLKVTRYDTVAILNKYGQYILAELGLGPTKPPKK